MTARSQVWAVLLVAAVGGAGTMVVELAAVRLLAPWFGSSQVVWTNVIAVVLLALAVGYVVGGWLSRTGNAFQRLSWVLLVAAVLTAAIPALSGSVSAAFLPEGLALHETADVVVWGSLASALALFLPPAVVLGCVAPLAVQAVQDVQHGSAGRAGGAVLSVSTLGSLFGVFATSHLLLPRFGLGATFEIAAGFLATAGSVGWFCSRASRSSAGALVVLLGVTAATTLTARPARPAPREGQVELAYGESAYQSVRIVEDRSDPSDPVRYLQVNEGFDSFQSVWQPEPGLLPSGFYYNDFALPPAWDDAPDPWRLLVLGLGAGTTVRVIEGTLEEGRGLDVTGVELDPLVVAFARAHMDLAPEREDRRTLAGMDARVALRNSIGGYDQIVLDCYANQVEIPPHLCTVEFFREARAKLAHGGWLCANLGGFGFDDPVVDAVAQTCANAFGADVLLMRVPHSRNFALLARNDAPLPLIPDPDDGALALDVRPIRSLDVRALIAPRELPGSWSLVSPRDASPLTDDFCPIEQLQLESIRFGAARLTGGDA